VGVGHVGTEGVKVDVYARAVEQIILITRLEFIYGGKFKDAKLWKIFETCVLTSCSRSGSSSCNRNTLLKTTSN